MQSSTGCRINVSSQFNQNDPEREIALAGTRDAINRARQAIEEKVEASVITPLYSISLKTTNLAHPVLKVTQRAPKPPTPRRAFWWTRPRFLLATPTTTTATAFMGILRPAPTNPTTATPLRRTSRRSGRRPNNCGPERPICAVRRLPGVLCHVLCGDDATTSGAGWCWRRCAGDLILCLVFMLLRFSPGLGHGIFVVLFCWSFFPLYSFRFFFLFFFFFPRRD